MISSLALVACGAASEVGTQGAPDSLDMFDPSTSTAAPESEPGTDDENDSEPTTTSTSIETTTSDDAADPTTSTTDDPRDGTTVPPTTASTVPAVDPVAAFCGAAGDIVVLGTSVSLDDKEAAAVFFDATASTWAAAADVAPGSISGDVATVATFRSELRDLLAANDYDLFAAFEEATALEVDSGADQALIRSDQFIYANCEITPPTAEQATAVFYGSLLATAEDQTYLAELLASAEVFSLDGANCFVSRASADVMHPLVGAPSTSDQDTALATVLEACQLSIGT